jgi:Zn ribbon nucleic-acid-binding protein
MRKLGDSGGNSHVNSTDQAISIVSGSDGNVVPMLLQRNSPAGCTHCSIGCTSTKTRLTCNKIRHKEKYKCGWRDKRRDRSSETHWNTTASIPRNAQIVKNNRFVDSKSSLW